MLRVQGFARTRSMPLSLAAITVWGRSVGFFAATFMAVNNKTWDSLSPATQKLMTAELAKVEDEMWAAVQKDDKTALGCNASGPCPWGEPGGMVPISASAADKAQLKDIVQNYVLKRWVDRCGKECASRYNQTVGAVTGIEAPM